MSPAHNAKKEESGKSKVPTDWNTDKSDLNGDWLNFFLLLLLYVMQGMPIGLASAIPIILQSKKNVTYQDQVGVTLECRVHIIFKKESEI